MSFFSVSLVSLLKNLIIFLIFTFTIATITLIERKILALVQRRVGPNYIGYKGRLQFIADALKMLLKHILIVSKLNKGIFIAVPALILMISYLF
jgi:NADH:ubiquinone oxidoreductase subunit H